MKKTLSLFSVMFVFTLFSCKKEHDSDNPVNSGIEDPYTNNSITLAELTPFETQAEKAGVYSYLGFGYDVTGRVADSASVRKQVIDIEALRAAKSSLINADLSTIGDAVVCAAGNATEISRQISSRIKDYRLDNTLDQDHKNYFKGELTSFFSRDTALSNSLFMGTILPGSL